MKYFDLFSALDCNVTPLDVGSKGSTSQWMLALENALNEYLSELEEKTDTAVSNLTSGEEFKQTVLTKVQAYLEENVTTDYLQDSIVADAQSLVNDAISSMRNDLNQIPLVNNLETKRVFRVLRENGQYQTYDNDEAYYSYPQAFTRLESGNFLCTFTPMNGDYKQNNQVALVEYDKDGNELRSVIVDGGHSNGMCYVPDENYIYIARCQEYVSGALTNTNTLLRVNYTTFEAVDIITLTGVPATAFVSWDRINSKLYAGNGLTAYEINRTDWSIVDSITLQIPTDLKGATAQTLYVLGDYIYKVTYKPNAITIFNKSDSSVYRIIKIPHFIDNLFELRELEDIEIADDGTFYCYGGGYTPNNKTTTAMVFKFNIKNNSYSKDLDIGTNFYGTIYVGHNNVTNPYGLSVADSFSELSEVNQLNKALQTPLIVELDGTKTLPYAYLTGLNNVRFNCNGATIEGLRLANCNNVTFVNFTITNRNKNLTSPIYLSDCNGIRFVDFTITDTDTYSQAINMSLSTVIIAGTTNASDWALAGKPFVTVPYGCRVDWGIGYMYSYLTSGNGIQSPNRYQITDNDIAFNTVGGNIPLTTVASNRTLATLFKSYTHINFEITTSLGGTTVFTFSLRNRQAWCCTWCNVADSDTNATLYEMNFDWDGTNITLTRSKMYSIAGATVSDFTGCSVASVYLSL